MKKIKFDGKILVIGCGGVARCTLPLLLKHLEMPAGKITVIDFIDHKSLVKNVVEQGVNYVVDKIDKDNLTTKLAQYVSQGDMILDLAWNIDCIEILEWCHSQQVMYLNTSVELWEPYKDIEKKHPTERTLYVRHMAIRERIKKWGQNNGATAVLEHGANPGLVSHFVKVALKDLAQKIAKESAKGERKAQLEKYINEENFPKLAQLTGTKVIHISERDTQIINRPKEVDEFVNTWSPEGLYEEGTSPAEMGWGTHEKTLPDKAFTHRSGPQNQICLGQMGIKTWVRSWVPYGEITGMVIRHGESFTLSDYLTVWENDKAVYRPTVHYAYCTPDYTINSIHELEMRSFQMHERQRVVNDEIISGDDQLGVLLMGHDFNSWWTGSMLDIHETRKLVPGQNATTLQVACSIIGAITWMIKNPRQGVRIPDELPYQEILDVAKPYLGPFVSRSVDWTPVKNRRPFFENYGEEIPKADDVWQFNSFLVK